MGLTLSMLGMAFAWYHVSLGEALMIGVLSICFSHGRMFLDASES
jgi:hypothetical protein